MGTELLEERTTRELEKTREVKLVQEILNTDTRLTLVIKTETREELRKKE